MEKEFSKIQSFKGKIDVSVSKKQNTEKDWKKNKRK